MHKHLMAVVRSVRWDTPGHPKLSLCQLSCLVEKPLGGLLFVVWKESVTSAISLIPTELLCDLREACGFLGHCIRWQTQGLSAAEIQEELHRVHFPDLVSQLYCLIQ